MGSVFETGLDVLRLELWICSKNRLAGLSGCELLQNQINRNPGSFQARFAHHHVGSGLDVFEKLHHPTVPENPSSTVATFQRCGGKPRGERRAKKRETGLASRL
jgi:hypothetical protein